MHKVYDVPCRPHDHAFADGVAAVVLGDDPRHDSRVDGNHEQSQGAVRRAAFFVVEPTPATLSRALKPHLSMREM